MIAQGYKSLAAVIFCTSIVACGGGGGSDDPAAPIQPPSDPQPINPEPISPSPKDPADPEAPIDTATNGWQLFADLRIKNIKTVDDTLVLHLKHHSYDSLVTLSEGNEFDRLMLEDLHQYGDYMSAQLVNADWMINLYPGEETYRRLSLHQNEVLEVTYSCLEPLFDEQGNEVGTQPISCSESTSGKIKPKSIYNPTIDHVASRGQEMFTTHYLYSSDDGHSIELIDNHVDGTPEFLNETIRTFIGENSQLMVFRESQDETFGLNLFATTNKGADWIKLTPPNKFLVDVSQHPTIASTFVALCEDGTVYISEDNALSWEDITFQLPETYAWHNIVIDQQGTIAISGSVDRSENEGVLYEKHEDSEIWSLVPSSLEVVNALYIEHPDDVFHWAQYSTEAPQAYGDMYISDLKLPHEARSMLMYGGIYVTDAYKHQLYATSKYYYYHTNKILYRLKR